MHAYSCLKVIDDPAWIRRQLEALTRKQEAAFPEPWDMSDAPHDFTERLIGQIVAIEISLTRLLGKWKVSQNQPPENRIGVSKGLDESGQTKMSVLVDAGPNT